MHKNNKQSNAYVYGVLVGPERGLDGIKYAQCKWGEYDSENGAK